MPASARDPAPLALERHDDGLVVLTLAVPGRRQNVLTPEVLTDLAAILEGLEAEARHGGGGRIRGLAIRSGLAGSFCAGADIGRLEGIAERPAVSIERICDAGRSLFGRLSRLPWPSVAVIDGACLGGGLELALACDLRLATDAPHTILGFSEVKLGLLPGWGGTVRLPRLIGPGPAVELMVSGDPVDARAATTLGLADACVPPEAALESARRLIDAHAFGTNTSAGFVAARRRRQAEAAPLDPAEREFLEATATAVILGRTGGHYPAPLAILRTVLEGIAVPAADAGPIESRAFAALARTDVCSSLVRVFTIGERNRRDSGVGTSGDDRAAAAAETAITAPAVVGAGIMGAGIAAAHLRAGFPVALVDTSAAAIAAAVPGILDEAAWDRGTKRTDSARALALAGRLRAGVQLATLAESDLVIESVTERPDVKQQVLVDLERTLGPRAVIATNTSTNPIARLAEPLADPARFCGMHFFNPVRRMTLVEVVRGPATSDATVAVVVAHAKRLGKCPIVVRDSPGFLVNRVLMPYLHEAVEMAREGVPPERIDRVARGFGMPMGPIELYDLIGLDTAFYAGLVLSAAFGDRIEASPVIPALVKAGLLGRKSGAGFYLYHAVAGAQREAAGRRPRIRGAAAGAAEILVRYAQPARDTPDRTILDRLLLPMLLEALRALDEGIVRDPADVDLAVIHALGFPPFRGGLLAWADSLGAAEVVRRLGPLADLGPRMLPTPSLRERAARGGRFTA